jgi:3-hydroxy-9,10-secoandrosta-1,3,5(10)-triene-9,17-dione monooxygenase
MTITHEKTDLAANIEALIPRLRELAGPSEDQRWLAGEAFDLLGEAGLWRAAVPERFGGLDLSVGEQIAVIEKVSRADGSLGWVSALYLANTWVASLYPDEAQSEMFADGQTRVSGAFAPTGTITPVEGGFRLNGSWKWNTGCRGAVWDGLAARLEKKDGPPEIFYCMTPASDLEIQDDWFAFGASATGSSQVTATNVFIPTCRALPLADALAGTTGNRSNTGATGRNYAFFAYILVESIGAFLGMAEGAYELFLKRLPGRGITYTPWTDQSASPVTHIQVATAANQISAARALTEHAVEVLQRAADRGELPTLAERAALRGEAAYAVELCRQAVSVLYSASGASVIMKDVPFQRFYRDIQALSQHAAMLLNTNLEVHGRVIVGLDPGTPFI